MRTFISVSLACLALGPLLPVRITDARESPTSDGPVSLLDEPVFRIPFLRKLPVIDGQFSPKEWEDASALSAFWSSNAAPDEQPYPAYKHLAPPQIQSQVFAGFDKESLYLAYIVFVYPENAWLKAHGRFPDVYNHPLYGLMGDDHIEIELRPYFDLTQGYLMGMFKWFINPTAVMSDQHWSPKEGEGRTWQSSAMVRAGVASSSWHVEMKIPLQAMKVRGYAEKDAQGQEYLKIPPPDQTAYRCWFKNGIGGAGHYVVLFDQHVWNTTKTKLVLDSQAVGFQILDLGPFMDDVIDVRLALKNHNVQSESVLLGFFVENAEGLVYSSFADRGTQEGLLELVPGEAKPVRLQKKFPGISKQDNFLWFDVRTAGRPAKVLFQNRLARFHSADPGPPLHRWREIKVESLAGMRPPKRDFDFRYQYSPTARRLFGFVDKGIHGASEQARRAVEAKLTLLEATEDEPVIEEKTVPFQRDYATVLLDLPALKVGSYKVSLLLFDANKRIVGERNPSAFYVGQFPWEKNTLGLEDIVWEPFEPVQLRDGTFETIRHTYTLAPSGLPAQIAIKPDPRELSLEKRGQPGSVTADELAARGRGPQLRAPMRLEAVVRGQRLSAQVVEPAKAVRQWKSELELASRLRVGPLDVALTSQYDCDGAMTCRIDYGADLPAEVDSFELLLDAAGPVDTRVGGAYGMLPSSGLDLSLPMEEGVVWDSANPTHLEPAELYYSRFVPFFFFGNGDRGWTWLADSDQAWMLDRAGSTMTLERDANFQVTWRVKFINHTAVVSGRRALTFALFTHPAKPKEAGYRRIAWLDWRPEKYAGRHLECLPNDGPWGIDGSDETFKHFLRAYPNGAPRLYINSWVNSGIPELQKGAYNGEWLLDSSAAVDRTPLDDKGGYGQPWTRPGAGQVGIAWGPSWEDYFAYHLERQIRIGRVPGWWWDEVFIPARTENVASGQAYLRNPGDVGENELPWQAKFASLNFRTLLKRLARLCKKNEIPNVTSLWATSQTTFESYASDSELVESAAAYSLSYDIDNITRYPISLFRFAANTCKGLTTRIKPGLIGYKAGVLMPGDDPRLDRAVLGRALLHDIGVFPEIANTEHLLRMVRILYSFGYFDEEQTETIPYWRSLTLCRYGEAFSGDAFELTEDNPFSRVYVTIYRRPHREAGGRKGYQALFVIHNENGQPVRGRLHLLQPDALLGGPNNLRPRDVYRQITVPPSLTLANYWHGSFSHAGNASLSDLESLGCVSKATKAQRESFVESETYGPIYVPAHDFRILLARFDPGQDDKPAAAESEGETWWQQRNEILSQTWWKHWKDVPKQWNRETHPDEGKRSP